MGVIGLILLILAPVAFLVGLILVCFQTTQKAGLITILSAIASALIGYSMCSFMM